MPTQTPDGPQSGDDDLARLETDLGRMAEPTMDLGAGAGPAPKAAATIRRYTLLERLGEGGMGVVYRAYDARLDRKVALKVLRREESAQARARFAREAQALAKLHHPNVVTVFDAGEVGERPYLAMALVEGSSLRAWLRERPRTWREIVAVFLGAGRGLAAAHAAGLVHRDVKPDNILVGKDGSVQVADFGVVRMLGTDDLPGSATESGSDRLTRDHDAPGTPRYMPPERHADARGDQYAFCVSLREALTGVDAPSFARRVVERGLRENPDERYPSMDALLVDLGRDPARARRGLFAAGAALVCAAAIALVSMRAAAPGDPCAATAGELAGVWDDAMKGQTRAAFTASGHVDAADNFTRAAAHLDGYARDWLAMRAESCQASAVRHTQSDTLLDRRTACLDQRRTALRQLTQLLTDKLDGAAVSRSVQAAAGLENLAGCADTAALLAQSPPSRDPRMAEIDARLASARALKDLGRYPEAETVALALYAEAPTIDHLPTRARALLGLAATAAGRGNLGDPKRVMVEAGLREGLLAASAARLDQLEAMSWPNLMWVMLGRGKAEESIALELPARVAIQRAGGQPHLEARMESMLASGHREAGRPEDSLRHAERALALEEKSAGPDDLQVTPMLEEVGQALERLGRHDEARAVLSRRVAILERVLGPGHPRVADALHDLAGVNRVQYRNDEARALFTRALEIYERVEGSDSEQTLSEVEALATLYSVEERYEDSIAGLSRLLGAYERKFGAASRDLAVPLTNLGAAEAQLGDVAAARGHLERARDILDATLPPGHVYRGVVRLFLGYTELRAGNLAVAEEYVRAGKDIIDKAAGPENEMTGDMLEILGSILVERGRAAEAVPLLEREVAIKEKSGGAESLGLANALHHYGDALVGAARPADALPVLERGEALRAKSGHDLLERGGLRFALARARWAAGQTASAREAARAAVADFKASKFGAARAAVVESWLTAHR